MVGAMSEALDDIKPLLFTAEPYRDESLPGYIVRLTELNDYRTPAWVLTLAGLEAYSLSRIPSYCLKPEVELTGLARLAGVSEEALRGLLYEPIGAIKSRQAGDYCVFGNRLPFYTIRLHRPKLCPLCLVEHPYVRKLWELALVTSCPEHNCLLMDRCPSCGKVPSWRRRRVCECKCGADWRKLEPRMLLPHESVVARNVYRLCGVPCHEVSPARDGVRNRLLELDLWSFVRALVFVSSQFDGRIDTMGKCFATNSDNARAHELLLKGFHVFDDFPQGFYRFLDWRKENPSRRGPVPSYARGWHRVFDGYRSALLGGMATPEFNFLRDAFGDYLRRFNYESALAQATHVPTGIADLKALRARMGETPEDSMSLRQARRSLGVSQPTIEKFIDSGVLEAVIGRRKRTGGLRRFLITRASVERLQAQLDRTSSLRRVGVRLGLQDSQARELVVGGLLKPVRGRSVDNSRTWHIAERELQRLIEEVRSRVLPRPGRRAESSGTKQPSVYSFSQTLSLLRRAGFGLCELVEGIKTGRVRTYRKGRRLLFRALEFEAADLLTFITPEYAETYSITEAAKSLDMSHRKVTGLVESGVLKARLLPRLKLAGLRIRKDAVGEFRETFITSDELRRAARVSMEGLECYLSARGIEPVWLNGGVRRMCVLPRSLVAARELQQEVPKQLAVHVPGILSPDEAARALEVTVDDVQSLIADGLLKPYSYRSNSRADAARKQLLFSRHSVEKYLRQRDELRGLISAPVAARLLGYRKTHNFLFSEVRRELLKPIKKMDGKRRNLYFDRARVEALAAERASLKALRADPAYINTKAAAEILGVNVSAVSKMIADGVIEPRRCWRGHGGTLNLYRRTDIEELRRRRDAYKADCARRGKSRRFGRPSQAAQPAHQTCRTEAP